jgi:hypothetical protein
MPASRRSLEVTNAYRARLAAIRQRAEARARQGWPTIDTLDGTRWADQAAQVVAAAQTEAVRATAGYVTAYVSTELGRRVPAVRIDSRQYAGSARDGRPLPEALRSPLIGVLGLLKQGRAPHDALRIGLHRGLRMIEVDLMHAGRAALLDTIEADDRLDGWQRATAGTCGACMSLSGTSGASFQVHPGCQCQPQPVVRGVPNRVPLLTGAEMFRRLTVEEQDAQFGPEKADALRAGDVELADLVQRSPLATGDTDFITEKPLDAAQ